MTYLEYQDGGQSNLNIELNITGRLPSAGNLKLNCASRAHSFHVKTNTAKQTFIRYTIYFYVLKTHLKEDKLFFLYFQVVESLTMTNRLLLLGFLNGNADYNGCLSGKK